MHRQDGAGSRMGACIFDAAFRSARDPFRGSMQIIPNKVIINNCCLSLFSCVIRGFGVESRQLRMRDAFNSELGASRGGPLIFTEVTDSLSKIRDILGNQRPMGLRDSARKGEKRSLRCVLRICTHHLTRWNVTERQREGTCFRVTMAEEQRRHHRMRGNK